MILMTVYHQLLAGDKLFLDIGRQFFQTNYFIVHHIIFLFQESCFRFQQVSLGNVYLLILIIGYNSSNIINIEE